MAGLVVLESVDFERRSEFDPLNQVLRRRWIRARGTFNVSVPNQPDFKVTLSVDGETADDALPALRDALHQLMSQLADDTADWSAIDATPPS